jgi:hypothetical protein
MSDFGGADTLVDLTMMSRSETQNKNTTNHHIIGSIARPAVRFCEFRPFV